MPTKKLRIKPSPKPPSRQDAPVPREEDTLLPKRMPRAYPLEGPVEELPAPPIKDKRRIGRNA